MTNTLHWFIKFRILLRKLLVQHIPYAIAKSLEVTTCVNDTGTVNFRRSKENGKIPNLDLQTRTY